MLVTRLRYTYALIFLALASAVLLPARADQKSGMPDLAQEEETCLPTSTTNLIVWFGKHGYPKLIVPGDSDADGYIHTIHAIMGETNARYDLGTRTDAITSGIAKYIRDAGYSCDVEYRGLDWTKVKFNEVLKDPDADKYKDFESKTPAPFTQDWLSSNDDPTKGFILLLAFCNYDRNNNSFHYAINAGHAVTLVDAQPDTLLIHDPAHWASMPGRKIITPNLIENGTLHLPGYEAPVSGLLLLSGSELEAPPDAVVMLTGAVCVTMHPDNTAVAYVGASAGAPGATVGATPAATTPKPSTTPAAPASGNQSWAMWLFDLFFKKSRLGWPGQLVVRVAQRSGATGSDTFWPWHSAKGRLHERRMSVSSDSPHRVTKAVILAAGKGTRMGDLTKAIPKPMLEVRGKPVLQRIVEGLRDEAKITEIFIVTGWCGEVIRDHFGDGSRFGIEVAYGEQVVQDGTGKAPELARAWVGDAPFLFTYGDILLEQAADYALLAGAFRESGVIALKDGQDLTKGGAVVLDKDGFMIELVEKGSGTPPANAFYNAGIYLMPAAIFDFTAKLEKSPRGEYEFTDALKAFVKSGAKLRGVILGSGWADVRDPGVLGDLNQKR